MYSQDFDDHFPPANQWATQAYPYIKNRDVFHCPRVKDKVPFGYAFNGSLSKAKLPNIKDPGYRIALFESDASIMDTFGGIQALPKEPRHDGFDNFGFVDGHARALLRPDHLTDSVGTCKF